MQYLAFDPYTERLSLLGIDRLELWRIRADLVMCYKIIIYGLVDIPFDAFFKFSTSSTRSHPLKLHCVRKKCPPPTTFVNNNFKS